VPRLRELVPIFGFLLVATACGGSHEDATQTSAANERPLTVYAAASLTEVFPTIDSKARYNFAGSDELAAQIREGAPADVYAAASSKYPQALYQEGLVEVPATFASNLLVLIVPKDNPAGIEKIADVARPGTKLVVAAEGVPVGDYTREVLDKLQLTDALENVVSNEEDVKGVVAKVALGEAEAGFVYATDAATAGVKVRVIELPKGSQPPIEYQIAVAKRSTNKKAAEAFVQKVLAPGGQQALASAGFLIP
jgi:molybdate transport system substrate-binding protein